MRCALTAFITANQTTACGMAFRVAAATARNTAFTFPQVTNSCTGFH
jgi:hypothetical protein